MAKQPDFGDWIEHTCALNGTFEGRVIEKLSMQFIYKTDNGYERFCLYTEAWRKIPKLEKTDEDKDTHKPARNTKQRKNRKS